MKKKVLSLMLSGIMAAGLLMGCGGGGAAGSKEQTDSSASKGDYEEVTYAFVSFNTIPDDTSKVEEAINKISRKKIGVEVHLMPLSVADYAQQVSLAAQNGEVDIFHSLGDLSQSIANDMTLDITDMLDEDAPETKKLIGDEWLKTTSKDGKIYGIPTLRPFALQPMLIYRKDLAAELGLDMNSIKDPKDLTAIFEQVKKARPDITPLAPVGTGDSGMSRWCDDVDFLGGDYTKPIGVIQGDDMTVKSFFSLDQFKENAALVRDWYEKGLIMKDAATTTSAAAELMSSGSYFAYVASYSYPLEDTAASLSAPSGYDVGAIALGESYLDTTSINAITQCISSTSKHPDAALKFLNLTYTDPEVINTILYGIEGEDYVKNDDGTVSYPEGQDASTVPYTAQLSCGVLGNFFIQWPLEGSGSKESLEWEDEQNHKAKMSPAMGFTFDASSVQTQLTAVSNVLQQYFPGIQCGSVDPEVAIPEFEKALKDAGYDDILAAKQEQLDAWMAEQK